MSAKFSVGFSRKLGRPDFGSVGASCNVEVELEAELLSSDLESFHERVRGAFFACRQAVQDELARVSVVPSPPTNGSLINPQSANSLSSPFEVNGTRNENRGYAGSSGGTGPRPASPKQLGFARQLASRTPGIGLQGIDDLTRRIFGKHSAELTSFEASNLIETLQGMKAGNFHAPEAYAQGVRG